MARTTTNHRILIQSSDVHDRVQLELPGSARITPGMLLKNNGGSLILHPTAGSFLPGKLIALENPYPDTDGSPTDAAVDIPYAVGERVRYLQARPGDVCNMLLGTLTGSASVTEGVTQLVSDGGGGVVAPGGSIVTGEKIVGIPAETVDNSGGTARVRLKVRII